MDTPFGQFAFSGCTSLTSMTISDSVTTIGNWAFRDCTSLTSMTIGSGIAAFSNHLIENCSALMNITVVPPNRSLSCLDGVLFNGNRTTLLCYPAGRVDNTYEIPDSVTSIGQSAFAGSSALTHMAIPGRVATVGGGAFYRCTNLARIKIPEGVTMIGDDMFRDCTSLSGVTIPRGVTRIGHRAFLGCIGLVEVTIPESITVIGGSAFRDCVSMDGVSISARVTEIGDLAFYGCRNLTRISVDADNPNYSSVDGVLFNKGRTKLLQFPGGKRGVFAIPESATTILSRAFHDSTRLTAITIPDRITSIEKRLFYGCTSLASVIIPDSVTMIGDLAFYGCTSLSSVTIPESVTSIGQGAFRDCRSLTNVTISARVTKIGDLAFYGCGSLASFDVDPANPNYSSLDGVLFSRDHTRLLQYPGGKEGDYTIPGSVTSIGSGAFRDCTRLTQVAIPASINVDGFMFKGCSSLTSIAVASDNPNNSSVDGVLFNKEQTWLLICPGGRAGAYTIPDSVTAVGFVAFDGCAKLTSVTIPSSVISIHDINSSTFNGCSNLIRVDVAPDNPNFSSMDGVLFNKEQTELRRCPGGRAGAYVIPNSVTTIGREAFSLCTNLTSVTVPDVVRVISHRAFESCSNLTEVRFEGDAPDVEESAFSSSHSALAIYYRQGKKGWGKTFGGRPTAEWKP